MDSLLASYASSDEEDEKPHQKVFSSSPNEEKHVEEDRVPKTSGFLSSLPPPKSSPSFLSSLPPPKVRNPISSTSVTKNPQKINEAEEQPLLRNRKDLETATSLPRPSSSLFSSLPQPKSSSSPLFSSLPSPKTQNTDQEILPQSSSASAALASRKVVQFRPPTMNPPANFGNEDDEDEDEDEKKKRSKKSQSLVQTSSVKSFLSSIPKPKNSATLGALPSASGSGRRSILETEVPGSNDSDVANAQTGSMASSNGVYYDPNSADHQAVTSTNSASCSFDHVAGVDYSNWGSGSENYVSYDGYSGYGNVNGGVTGEDYPNLGGGTKDYANYASESGSYATYDQYQGNWTGSQVPQMTRSAENVLRMPGKRGRNDAPPEIVEVKQDELMKNRPREDQAKLTGIAFGPSYQPAPTKGKPTKLHKRKHQIGSLYFDMKQKEMELAERRARGFLTKAQTQGKYGW